MKPLTRLLPPAWRRWCRRRAHPRIAIPLSRWRRTVGELPLLQQLPLRQRVRLRAMAERFLGRRTIYGADDFMPDADMAARIAALACLPVMHLGEDWLASIRSVVVYPAAFIAEHDERDEAGVVHRRRDVHAGEAWENGTMVLSWSDVLASGHRHHGGFNVVIHEVAHFLDGANGAENGFPPLGHGHDRRQWTADFAQAFHDLQAAVAGGHHPRIDPYAATSPAEFFAVSSELYFECPSCLAHAYPAVYRHLARFYGFGGWGI